eukprot:1936067-Prymnesium_polylepis.1
MIDASCDQRTRRAELSRENARRASRERGRVCRTCVAVGVGAVLCAVSAKSVGARVVGARAVGCACGRVRVRSGARAGTSVGQASAPSSSTWAARLAGRAPWPPRPPWACGT